MTSLTTSVTLELKSNVVGVMAGISREFTSFNRILDETQTKLNQLAKALGDLGKASGAVAKISENMRKLETAMSGAKLDAGFVTGMRAAETASEKMLREARELTVVLERNGVLAGQSAARTNAAANNVGRQAAARGGGHLGHDLTTAGLGAGLMGAAGVDAIKKMLGPAMEQQLALNVMANDTRMSPADKVKAGESAYQASRAAPGTTIKENQKLLADMKTAMGDLDHATEMLPQFARMTATLQVLNRLHGGSGDQGFAAAKGMELIGAMTKEEKGPDGKMHQVMTPDEAIKFVASMTNTALATGGRVMPTDYLNMIKQGGPAAMLLDKKFLHERLPTLMMSEGGLRVGTGLMSMLQVFTGEKLTPKSLEAMTKLGLAPENAITEETDKRGKKHQVAHPDRIFNFDLMSKEPDKWLAKAREKLVDKGFDTTEKQIADVMKFSQRSTIARQLAIMLKDALVIEKDAATNRAIDPNAAKNLAENDPTAKLQQFQAALTNFATVMGAAGMGDAMSMLDKVTAGLNRLTEWAHTNPDQAKKVFDALAIMSAIGVALGAFSTALFLFGPALRILLRLPAAFLPFGEGGAAFRALAALAGGGVGSLAAVVVSLGLLGIAAAEFTKTVPATPEEKHDLEVRRDQANKLNPTGPGSRPSPGMPPGDRPVRPISPAPAAAREPGQLHSQIFLDGTKIAEVVSRVQARQGMRAPSGGPMPDSRMGSLYQTDSWIG